MYRPAAIRIALLGVALAFTPAANADAELDEMVMGRVMPRFDKEARVLLENSGARYLSTRWNRETRTLVAVGEVNYLGSSRFHGIKYDQVGALCRHSAVRLIRRFLEKYDVTIAFVYGEKHERADPVIVEISHRDLSVCV